MTDEPASIAGRLTRAQREAVVKLPESGGYIWYPHIAIRKPTADVLTSAGIFAGHRHYWREFTPLGLAVRAHLTKEPQQ